MEGESSIFGRFIHETIPESLRVDPFAVEVTPRMEMQKPSFSIREFSRNYELNVVAEENDCEEVDESLNENSTPLSTHTGPEPANMDLVEVEDEELGSSSQQMSSSARSFSTFMFDVYQSASFSVPNVAVQQRSRLQYIQEYYRRMIHLLESSKKQIPASEEALSSLVISIFSSVEWCPICLEDYLDNSITTVLPCKHRFHYYCIKRWLHVNHTCPVCKMLI